TYTKWMEFSNHEWRRIDTNSCLFVSIRGCSGAAHSRLADRKPSPSLNLAHLELLTADPEEAFVWVGQRDGDRCGRASRGDPGGQVGKTTRQIGCGLHSIGSVRLRVPIESQLLIRTVETPRRDHNGNRGASNNVEVVPCHSVASAVTARVQLDMEV